MIIISTEIKSINKFFRQVKYSEESGKIGLTYQLSLSGMISPREGLNHKLAPSLLAPRAAREQNSSVINRASQGFRAGLRRREKVP